MHVKLAAYVDQSETSEEKFHCVVLNGYLCSMFEELYLSAVIHRPWKEFLLDIIGSNEANLPAMITEINNAYR